MNMYFLFAIAVVFAVLGSAGVLACAVAYARRSQMGLVLTFGEKNHTPLFLEPGAPSDDPTGRPAIGNSLVQIRAAAETGKAEEMFHQGLICLYGVVDDPAHGFRGSPDRDGAKAWFEKAAKKNHAGACYELHWFYGGVYHLPDDPPVSAQDEEKAVDLMLRALKGGNPFAKSLAKSIFDNDLQRAMAGDGNAMMNVAHSYLRGDFVPRNRQEARTWIIRASKTDSSYYREWAENQRRHGGWIPK